VRFQEYRRTGHGEIKKKYMEKNYVQNKQGEKSSESKKENS
jgi:hypothetical protein